jgi:hypothetical protein
MTPVEPAWTTSALHVILNRTYFFVLPDLRAEYGCGQYTNFDARKKNSLAVVLSMEVRRGRKTGVSNAA